MPRYLIERNFDPLDDEILDQIGQRSKQLLDDRFPMIRWEHSHVVVDEAGNTKSFCIYESPSEDLIRQHAGELGYHIIGNIYEIGGDVSPRDFAST